MNLSPVARRTFPLVAFLGLALGLVLPVSEARADYFYTLTPCRAFDSRPGKPDAPQLDSNSKRTIKLTEKCGIPADASAVAANVTVVAATGEGHIVVFAGPASESQPNPPVGTIPFRREQTVPARANNVFIPLAADGSGTANILPVVVPSGAKLGVVIDVTGFFRKSPIAVDDSATVAEDSGATTIDVRANDLAAGSPAFSISSVTQPANGTVVITNAGQDLTYTPNANYCNTPPGTTLDTFTYTLTPTGSTATVSVSVTCVDDDPTAVDDTAMVTENDPATAIDVLANDLNADGGPISITSVTQPANGTVVITGGGTGLTYQPNAGYCNTPPGTTLDTFTYTLTPGGDTATVSVTVNCSDDAPTAVNDSATVAEDSGPNAIDVLANDTDPDGGPISITSVTQPANGTVVITGGGTGLTYAPNADYCNTPPGTTLDTFTYTLTPGGSSATVSMTVTCVEDDPTAVADAATVAEDSSNNPIDVLANDTDPDGGAISVTSVTQPANGAVVITGGGTGVSYTPNANYCNTPPGTTLDTFTYTLTPGGSSTTVTVTVTCVDDDPVAVADAATVAEDSGANAIDVLANDTDIDAGPKSVTSVTQPANGTVVITGGGTGVSYTPNADYCNTPPGTTLDTFSYTLTPGGSSATVTVSVTCVDDNPTAVADAATVTEDSSNNAIDVLANDTDPDGGAKSVQSVTQPANGTVAITGGGTGVSYTPNANYCNTPPGTTLDTFTYTLTPGGSSTTVSVSVTCVDDNPVAVADSATVAEDSGANAIDVLANDTDVDGGTKSVQSVTQPANGTVAITGGGTGVSYTPNPNYCNAPPGTTLETFTYTLTPGGSSTTVTVTVTCVDDPPTAVADGATVNEDSGANAISVLANDTDPDAGPISIQSVTQPANGTVVITGGGTGLTYAPNLNYCNLPPGTTPDTFTYTLTPGGSSATVSVLVQCINDVPQVNPATLRETFHTIGNTAFEFKAAQSLTPGVFVAGKLLDHFLPDPDGPAPLSASLVSSTSGAEVVIDTDGSFSYIPAPGATGSDTFTYRVSDGLDFVDRVVTINLVERVWYVRNNAPAGGDGQSDEPFDTLAEAQTASGANDFIFVYRGDGTNLGHTAGIILKNGQRLLGEHTGLSVPIPLGFNGAPAATDLVLVAGVAGNRPLIGDLAGTGVSATDAVPLSIAGVDVAASGNAIHWTTAAGFAGTNTGLTIRDVVVRGAGGKGVNILLQGTGALRLAFHGNDLTSIGTALDIQETGTGSVTITALHGNVVRPATGGTGINITNAIFDSVPGGGVNNVDGDNLLIGVSGDGVGGSGLTMTGVQGSLTFDDLDIFASNGTGLRVGGTAPGMTFAVTVPGTSIIEATGGPAVDVSDTSADLQLSSLRSTNSPSTGVSLTNVSDGAANAVFSTGSSSSITTAVGASGAAFGVSGGNAAITYPGTITNNGAGRAVSISSWTGDDPGDDILFSGAIDENGAGILLNGNSGSGRSITFSGGMDIDTTGTNEGFSATSNTNTGGLHITGTNTINSVNGTALRVTNTQIGNSGLTFRHISAGTGSGSSGVGIVVDNTGTGASNGGLTVTGNSGAGTGGTIQHKTGADDSTTGGIGIYLNNTKNASFNWMQLNDFDNFAIRGTGVQGFTLNNSVINGVSGNNGGSDEAVIRFENLTGSGLIDNSTIQGGVESNIRVINNTGTLNALVIQNSTIRSNSTTTGGDGIFARAQSGATMTVKVLNNIMHSHRDDHIQTDAENTGVMHTVITGNTLTSNGTIGAPPQASTLGGQITITGGAAFASTSTFNVSNNTITGAVPAPITINVTGTTSTASGLLSGTINNNNLGQAGSANSGSSTSDGISVIVNGAATINANITNNRIRQFNNIGMQFIKRDGSGSMNLTVTGNTVAEPVSPNALQGILVTSGATSGPPADSGTVCADIGGAGALANTVTGPNFGGDLIRVRQRFSTFVQLPGYGGGAADTTAVTNYLIGRNTITNEAPNAKASASTQAPGSFLGGGACTPGAAPL